MNVLSTFCSHKQTSPRNITEICLLKYHNQKLLVLRRWTRLTKQLMKVQRRRNTGAMPILPMITLLHEFLIVSCVLCVPQVDSPLYQIKHCFSLMLYGKYNTQRVVSRHLLPTLFMLYFLYNIRGSALSSTYITICIAACYTYAKQENQENQEPSFTISGLITAIQCTHFKISGPIVKQATGGSNFKSCRS